MTHFVRVITYNLLAQELINDKRFPSPKVKPHYKLFENRLIKTKSLLTSWMKSNLVICLQEVSEEWIRNLSVFFTEYNYSVIMCQYSHILGVCICYPQNHYVHLQTDEFRCGEYIETICNKNIDIKHNELYEELKQASVSNNKLLSVLLQCNYFGANTGKNIWISTYHMPCMFMKNYYILSHIHAIKNHINQLLMQYNTTQSIILCGDFNLIPDSIEYNYLVNNNVDNEYMQNLSNFYSDINLNDIKLRSVHKQIYNKEPTYTNVSKQKNKEFINCIDYILVNETIDVFSCLVGLKAENPIPAYPNGLCPSDHIPLSAVVKI
jgi:mRNA deadenylase 3'-5' endonuclease subunit Ccr4